MIELLVVIAIIAILAALFFPALRAVRNSVDSTGCVSNLRQVGIAIQAYVNDHDSRLPEAIFNRQGPYADADRRRIQNHIWTYIGGSPPKWGTNTYTKILECPAWKRKNQQSTLYMFPYFIYQSVTLADGSKIYPFGAGDSNGSGSVLTPPPMNMMQVMTQLADVGISTNLNGVPTVLKGLSKIYALRDYEDPGTNPPNHADYRNALFFDWHVGRLDLNNNPL